MGYETRVAPPPPGRPPPPPPSPPPPPPPLRSTHRDTRHLRSTRADYSTSAITHTRRARNTPSHAREGSCRAFSRFAGLSVPGCHDIPRSSPSAQRQCPPQLIVRRLPAPSRIPATSTSLGANSEVDVRPGGA